MFVHVYTHALACIHTLCFNFYQWHRKNLCDKRISVLLKVSIMHSDLSLNSVCITEEYINKSPFHFGACECWMPWVPKLSTESHKKQDAVGGPLIPASQETHWGPVKGLLMTLASRRRCRAPEGAGVEEESQYSYLMGMVLLTVVQRNPDVSFQVPLFHHGLKSLGR